MNCPKDHGPMTRGQGFFVCLTCGERIFGPAVLASPAPSLSFLETLPFPVAFPLAHAFDAVRCPDAHNRFDNMIFAASQALRLTALLLLSDYFECEATCSKLNTHIRSLRMPHWENWTGLARALSKFWKGHERDKPDRSCQFAWLPDAWLEVACTRQEESRWRDALRQIPGKAGQAVSVNDAFQKARNDAHHRLTTHSTDSARACEKALQQLLPLLTEACVLLFPQDKLVLLRQLAADSDRCIRLVGPHLEKRFISEPIPQFSDHVFAKSQVVALSGPGCVPLHPLVVPIDPEFSATNPFEVGVLEPATLLDQAKDREVVLLGVEQWWVKEEYAKPFLDALERKRINLGLSNDETKMWTLAAWSNDNAKANLEELTGKKYFPDCYVERRDVDDLFNQCLQADGKGLLLTGEAGSGKSSLLCRLVEKLTENLPSQPMATQSQRKSSPKKAGDLGSYLKFDGTHDAVVFLSGRAAFGGDTNLDGSALLCGAVLQKAGVQPGAFASLEKLAAALNASVRDDTVPRKVWLILDALNEADRFEDLLAALDRFLPNLPRFPWLKLIVSIRRGAYQALNQRHSDLARAGASFLENEHHFFSFESMGSDKTVPYLEIKPFEFEEAARAHELRQQRLPERSVSVPWNDLGEPVRELLLNPLHLHLFHETFSAGQGYPSDMDAESLLNAYLEHLCTQNAGLERTLGQIGTLMFNVRVPALSVAKADEWLAEWRNSGAVPVRSAKLNPIEELVSASLLLRPTEHGVGTNRQLAAFQFRHQRLCEQVLLRELRRQIYPRKLPNGKELTAWVRQIVAPQAQEPAEAKGELFKELLGAVQCMIKEVILSGAADVFTALFTIEPEEVRSQVILAALMKSRLLERSQELEAFLCNLTKHAEGNPETAEALGDALLDPLYELGNCGQSLVERRFRETVLQLTRACVAAEPHNLFHKRQLANSTGRLGVLCSREGDPHSARHFFEEAIEIRRSLVTDHPESQLDQSDLTNFAISLTQLGCLAEDDGDSRTARDLFERAIEIERALVADNPYYEKLGLSSSLIELGRLAEKEGDLHTARTLFKEALEIDRMRVAEEPNQTVCNHSLSRSLDYLGIVAEKEGDAATARDLFEEALEISRALVEAKPHRADYKSNLSVSLYRLGRLSLEDGDTNAARAFFEEDLQICRELVNIEPHRADHKRALSVSLECLGCLLLEEEEDSSTIRALFEESLQIRSELVEVAPLAMDHKWDLSLSLQNLGRLSVKEGEAQTAHVLFEEALQIQRAIVEDEPHRTDRKQIMSALIESIGLLFEREGNAKTACAFYEEALEIYRVLVAEEPLRTDRKHDLSVLLLNLGEINKEAGDMQNARAFFEETLEVCRALVALEPLREDRKINLCVSLSTLGRLAGKEGESRTARALFEESHQICRALVATAPHQADYKSNLSLSLYLLGEISERDGDVQSACAFFEEALHLKRSLLAEESNDPMLPGEIVAIERALAKLTHLM